MLVAATAARTADPTVQQLFDQVRAKVIDNIHRVPRYTCVETVNRAQYRPQLGSNRPSGCPALIAARGQAATPGLLRWHDRLRIDVAVLDGVETFAWAGARQFETSHLDDLASHGTTGSGDFISFLASVFGNDTDNIAHEGPRQTAFGGLLTAFTYNVPFSKSHYRYHSGYIEKILPFHGEFYVDAASGDLRRLTVETTDPPSGSDLCHLVNTMDYRRAKIGGGEFILPQVTTMEVLYQDGSESKNETHFADCHEYVGESTIRFDDPDDAAGAVAADTPLRPLPPGVRLQIGLEGVIDTDTAAAGDVVTGVVLRDVKDKKLGVLALRNDHVRGRILGLEQFMDPQPRWIVTIRFDAMERRGVEQSLSLTPRDDGERTRLTFTSGNRTGQARPLVLPPLPHPPGSGVFVYQERGKLVLDKGFHSEWETR